MSSPKGCGYPGQDWSLFEKHDWALPVASAQFVGQPDDWSCAVATYQMMLKVLGAPLPSWSECVAIMDANEVVGTSTVRFEKAVQQVADAEGLQYVIREGGSLGDLRKALTEGWVIALAFLEPVERVGHYGILQAINEHAIMIADPFYGVNAIMLLAQFEWETGFEDPKRVGWYGALRRHDPHPDR